MNVTKEKCLLFILFLCLGQFELSAQGWELTFGTPEHGDKINSVIETPDNGFLLKGATTEFNGNYNFEFTKLDQEGNIQWSRIIEEAEYEDGWGNDLIPTSDGGYVFVGWTENNTNGGQDVVYFKINNLGEVIVRQNYGGFEEDRGASITKTADGNYLITATTYSYGDNPDGENDLYLIKIQEDGTEIWSKDYQTIKNCAALTSYELESGNFLTGYFANNEIGTGNDLFLQKTGPLGDSIWTKSYGGDEDDGAGFIIPYTSDTIYVTGHSKSYSADPNDIKIWVSKIDTAGNFISSFVVGEDGHENLAYGTVRTTDGGFAFTGPHYEFGDDGNLGFFKTDAFGNVQIAKKFGGPQYDFGDDIIQTSDGGYLAIGATLSFGAGSDFDAYVVRMDAFGNAYSNIIQGNVFHDNDCGTQDTDEALDGWLVKAVGPETYFGTTDVNGYFNFLVDTGVYEISVIEPNVYWSSCTDIQEHYFPEYYDTTTFLQFPMFSVYDCPVMKVDVSTPILRRCMENIYYVNYCNEGTIEAEDIYVEITLDPDLSFINSSIPETTIGDNTYRFDVENIDVGDCGSFQLLTLLDCDNTVLGQTHCVEAHIYPDSICTPSGTWDGSSIVVDGVCEGDSVLFTISNLGLDMSDSLQYIVIQDELLFNVRKFKLNGFETEVLELRFPATGSTYTLKAEQADNHPGDSQPTIGVEGCGIDEFGFFSLGHVTAYSEDDADPFVSIDCQENKGSFDPNDKNPYPTGTGPNFEIEPNTDLDYHIRFQNTGTDTAFTVVIRDTISPHLDINSIQPGASSHSYEFDLIGDGAIKFTFNDILLPDSNINEPASHGFVKFRINQEQDVAPGTIINNTAFIYFDFNEPIQTNNVFHTIIKEQRYGLQQYTVCYNDDINGIIYQIDSSYIDTLNFMEFDSIRLIDIMVLPTDYSVIDTVVMEGEIFHGSLILSDTNIVVNNYINAYGCDSSVLYQILVDLGSNNESIGNANIQVFPNPVNQILNVFIENNMENSFQYQLYDSKGMVVKQSMKSKEHSTGNYLVHIDVDQLNSGIYCFKMKVGEEIFVKKIVILD